MVHEPAAMHGPPVMEGLSTSTVSTLFDVGGLHHARLDVGNRRDVEIIAADQDRRNMGG